MDYINSFLEYLQLEKKYSDHTVLAYHKDIQSFYKFVNKTYQVDSLLTVDEVYVRRWVMRLKEQEVANTTVNRKISTLKTFYNYLLRLSLIEISPVANQKSLKTPTKILTPFSEREIEEAMLFVDDDLTAFEQARNKLIIHLLYATGLRRSELIELKSVDVDVDQLTIKVLGKRNKERVVPIYEQILPDVKKYIEEKSMINTEQEVFFVTQKGGKLYSTLVYRIINSYFSKVTTKQKKSPHVLRHSYATDLVNNGADLNSVKELLGHSSLAATQVYTHNSLDKLKQVYNKAHPRGAKKN